MPWKEIRVARMREEFVKQVLSGVKTKAALCREFGISRPTGDKWISRYLAGEALDDRRRCPKTIPSKTPEEIEQRIVEYRTDHKALGAVKIHRILENEGVVGLPCTKTINNILKRNGLISGEASAAATPNVRFEKSAPNEMWQADYKGHFAMKDGNRCHPLNIIDDCSRFNVCSKAMATETFEEIQPVMIDLFREFGMPFSLLCDNGNPWGTAQSTGFTQFEVWLMELGILTLHGRPLHPQTQGKEERFNGTMTRELLKYTEFENLADADRKFREYRDFYNNVRPHHALKLDTPAKHYAKSGREYPSEIMPWEYPEGCRIHKVKSSGYITVNGQGYYLSEAFGGKEIAVRKSHKDGCVNLYFRQFIIGQIDVARRVYTFRKAYLIEGDPRRMEDKVAENSILRVGSASAKPEILPNFVRQKV